MKLSEQIRKLSDELEQHTIEVRRTIHRNPELAFHEYKTSDLVCQELARMGIPYEKSPQEPGIVAVIDSGRPGKFLMLRADMDALPIQEQTGLPFASSVPDVMHACGHDVHTANLLAVGEILNRTKKDWNGKVKLVFQPAEESGGGGREMIRAGLMNELPDACFALHVEVGERGVLKVGKRYISAYTDGYTLTVRGRAGHSSAPQEGADAVYIAAAIITALHGIVSRNLSPMEHSTLNIGTIHGGYAPNIIADEVTLGAMMRNLSKEAREEMCRRIETISAGIAKSLGGSCECRLREGYPSVYNDEAFSDFVAETLKKHAGEMYQDLGDGKPQDWLVTGEMPRLGGEDFGFFAQKAPSCMIRVLMGGEVPAHHPKFCIDERYIKLCTRAMALTAAEFLTQDM
ncbi:MAG: amidohydrolase [Lachnospiraceae bacterium]|nr:amidohydrolase [Lachnospiraceae bacterium]